VQKKKNENGGEKTGGPAEELTGKIERKGSPGPDNPTGKKKDKRRTVVQRLLRFWVAAARESRNLQKPTS